MYKILDNIIDRNMSWWSRLLAAAFTGMIGVLFLVVAQRSETPIELYLTSACFLIVPLFCMTRGRVRHFIGSTFGVAVFIVGLVYLANALAGGTLLTGLRYRYTVPDALIFILVAGIPGLTYAYESRFGFLRQPQMA